MCLHFFVCFFARLPGFTTVDELRHAPRQEVEDRKWKTGSGRQEVEDRKSKTGSWIEESGGGTRCIVGYERTGQENVLMMWIHHPSGHSRASD